LVKKEDQWIGELVGVFSDPIIVMPGGWGEDLPEWIRPAITQGRLIANIEGIRTGEMKACDAEVCAYLFTASLTAPMDSDWTQIYLYIAGKAMAQWKKVEMPKDIKVEELTRNQMDDLNRLKAWIYRKRIAARLDRERGARREKKEEEAVEREKKEEEIANLQQKFDLGLDKNL